MQELQNQVVQAMQAHPIQPNLRGSMSVIGRGIDHILSLGETKISSLGLEGIIVLLENAFQIAVVDVNFEKVPDFIEDPLEAFAKSQIRPIVTALLGSFFGA